MAPVAVKICGLSTPETLDAALLAGADMVGFVHFPRSPRHLDLDAGRRLSARARGRAERVALVVDPDDALLDAVVEALDPDWIQLHGRESPERVAAARARTGRPVMKALGVATLDDLARVADYAAADRVLLDAKPAPGALPGGNGHAFDWDLIARSGLTTPFMLSGGLTPETVAGALAATGARAVDVSSGVERRPGEKDPDRIAAFVAAARAGS
ncbi:phosphoribosylanthranilate isomerase [Methylobacterium oryzihabitans]|uniref:N-(5'-phosphoribosyl)anthranilate isomerase n=1 Tax=Methylobacterium oryzihabitans TaxID=2499852 RepID=A0A437NXY1_9HYPH|nr:phosphoribosylanthranilate isomerase [Methylobacterium oryzihabitans]RVU14876.1 phosphoribosylanthranilate isomerase [Methylobacterium oryzihabitans]